MMSQELLNNAKTLIKNTVIYTALGAAFVVGGHFIAEGLVHKGIERKFKTKNYSMKARIRNAYSFDMPKQERFYIANGQPRQYEGTPCLTYPLIGTGAGLGFAFGAANALDAIARRRRQVKQK